MARHGDQLNGTLGAYLYVRTQTAHLGFVFHLLDYTGAGVFTGRQANHIKALSEDRAANAALEYMESANAWLVEALHRRGLCPFRF